MRIISLVMEITLLKPFGYCQGVIVAFSKALEYASSHKDEKIYMLGMLVHNEDAVKTISSYGVKVLDERVAPLLEQLEAIEDGATVIFSAHGHPPIYEEIAKQKHLKTIDTTCVHVEETRLDAADIYQNSHDMIYIGSKGHLEAEGFLAHFPYCSFFDVKSKKLDVKDKLIAPQVYAQTTLGYFELDGAMQAIQKEYHDAKLVKGRCLATSLRQQEVVRCLEETRPDALIILGSKTSNNSKKLAEIGESYHVPTFLCLNLEEVKKVDLSHFRKVAISSGASTSRETCLEVKDYLASL